MSDAHIWMMIDARELSALQAVSTNFDFRSALHPDFNIPPLHAVVQSMVMTTNYKQVESVKKMAQWLLKRGADPLARAPASSDYEVDARLDGKEMSHIRVDCAGHSAISLLVALKNEMKEKTDEAADHKDDDDWDFSWKTDVEDLTTLNTILCTSVTARRVDVDESVVAIWEQLRAADSKDIQLVCSDGQTGAHAALLSSSPVVAAMLQHSMREERERLITLVDTPVEAASLFLDLLYTGMTEADPAYCTAINALNLAHRWQCHGVTAMLERALASKLDDQNFEAIAEVAAEKQDDLLVLRSACVQYGKAEEQIRRKLRRSEFSTRVLEMCRPRPCDEAAATDVSKKRRRSF